MIDTGTGQKTDRMEEYIRRLLAYQSMPTLLKAKPSVLVTANKKLIGSRNRFFDFLGGCLRDFECSYLPLGETWGRIYLLLYYEPLLRQSLGAGQPGANMRGEFLAACGYGECRESAGEALERLRQLYRGYWENGAFPHEIGIFLGYPLADVMGFIQNRGRNYLLCGMWKVYQREEIAAAAFRSYGRMKEQAVGLLEAGSNLAGMSDTDYSEERAFLKKLLEY